MQNPLETGRSEWIWAAWNCKVASPNAQKDKFIAANVYLRARKRGIPNEESDKTKAVSSKHHDRKDRTWEHACFEHLCFILFWPYQ